MSKKGRKPLIDDEDIPLEDKGSSVSIDDSELALSSKAKSKASRLSRRGKLGVVVLLAMLVGFGIAVGVFYGLPDNYNPQKDDRGIPPAPAVDVPNDLVAGVTPTTPTPTQAATPAPTPEIPTFTVTAVYNLGTGAEKLQMKVPETMLYSKISSTMSTDSEIISTAQELVQSRAQSLGIAGTYGMYSGSVGLSEQRKKMYAQQGSTWIGKSSSTFTWKEAVFEPDFILEKLPELKADLITVTAKPAEGEDESTINERFRAFFDKYGTHYTYKVVFGGKLYVQYEVSSSLFSTTSEQKRAMQIAASYSFNNAVKLPTNNGVSVGYNISNEELKSFQESTQSSSWQINSLGGDPRESYDWSKWIYTLNSNETLAVVETKANFMADLISALDIPLEEQAQTRLRFARAAVTYYNTCPVGLGSVPCSGRGICDYDTRTCTCDPQYSGDNCASTNCPKDASGQICGGQGTCDTTTGTCICTNEWKLSPDTKTCSRDCRIQRIADQYGEDSVIWSGDHCVDKCAFDNGGCGQEAADRACKARGFEGVAKNGMTWETRSARDTCNTVRLGDGSTKGRWRCGFLWLKKCYPDTFRFVNCIPKNCD